MSTRPSSLLDISDPVRAYYLDRAVHHFGTHFDAAIRQAGADAKTQAEADRATNREVDKWLETGPRRFRNPVPGAVTR